MNEVLLIDDLSSLTGCELTVSERRRPEKTIGEERQSTNDSSENMNKKGKPDSGISRLFGMEIVVDRPIHEFGELEGALRKDSIPLNDQIKKLFEQGLNWSSIRNELGLSYEEFKFEGFLKLIGAPNVEEYGRRLRNYKLAAGIRARNKTGWDVNRRKAFKRDGGKCAVCGSVVGVNVHHIDQFSASKNSQLDNLTTLCQWHHAAAHENFYMFLFREFCMLAGEGSEVRYTKRDLRRVKQKARRRQLSKGVGFSTRAVSIRDRANRSLRRYITDYKEYVNSNFPVKIRILKRRARREDGSHYLDLSLRVGYKLPRTVKRKSRRR